MKKRKIELLAVDLFRANKPEFLKAFPDKKLALIQDAKKNKPRECLECIFLAHSYGDEGWEFYCPLGSVTFVNGKRANGCVLDE